MKNQIIEEKKTAWNREEMEEKLKEQIRTMRKMVGIMGGWNQSEAMVFGAALPNLVSFMYEEITSAEQAENKRIFDQLEYMVKYAPLTLHSLQGLRLLESPTDNNKEATSN